MRHLSIACAIALAATPAWADGVGVAAVSTTTTEPIAVRKAIAAVVGEGRAVRVTDDAIGEARAAVAGGAVPVATLEHFRRLREQIDEGWRAFVRVQVDFAASRLAAARTDAESLVALPGGAILYADAALRLGAVLNHLGRIADSQAILVLALALDPERPITLAEFSPDVVAAVDAVRQQPRPRQRVRIASEPAGATITVDGKELGKAPLDTELAVGQHVLVAHLPLHHPRALAVAIDPTSRDLRVDLDRDAAWTRLAEAAAPGQPEPAAQELVDATLRFADLDEIVLAADTDRRGGPALLVQRCAGIPARCTAVVEVGYGDRSGLPAAAREAWQAVKAADLRYPPSVFADARVTGGKTDDRCKLCRNRYLWGGVGVAAVVATVVVIAVVSGSRPPPVVGADPTKF